LASSLFMLLNGRIAGISGIISNALPPRSSVWALAFVVGLPAGVLGYHLISGAASPSTELPTSLLIIGGLLVGIGTRLGSGCTSGHGVCGLARLSTRSLVATLIFMTVAIVTVYVRGMFI